MPTRTTTKNPTYLRLGITRVPSGLMEAGAEFLHTRGLPLGKWTGLAWVQAEKSCGGVQNTPQKGDGPGRVTYEVFQYTRYAF